MQLAPMPNHGSVGRPDWQPLWTDYAPVTTPLRALGLPIDIETCGGETHITVDLPDGSFLLIAGTDSLPNRLSTVTGWRVMRGHEDNPTVDLGIYDSTVDGEQYGNGPDLTAMLVAITAWLLAEYPQTAAYLEAQTAKPEPCCCVVAHPITAQERQAVTDAFNAARAAGDYAGITIGLAQLTGSCPARTNANAWTIRAVDFKIPERTVRYTLPLDNPHVAASEYGWLTYELKGHGWELIAELGGTEQPLTLWRMGRTHLRAVWINRPQTPAESEPAGDAN